MKKFFFFLLAACMFMSCENEVENENNEAFQLTTNDGYQKPVFGKLAKSAVYDFHANVPWVATVSDSASIWLTIYPTSGDTGYQKVTFEVQENDQNQDRVGQVTFSGNGFEYVVDVVQYKDSIPPLPLDSVVPAPQDTTPKDTTPQF